MISTRLLRDATQLAEASYTLFEGIAPGDQEGLDDRLRSKEQEGNFSQSQAQDFVSNWALVDHLPNTPSGLSATLFASTSNSTELVLTIRGTEFFRGAQERYRDLGRADINGVILEGMAAGQIADLYNYWKVLTTPQGATARLARVVTTTDSGASGIFTPGYPMPGTEGTRLVYGRVEFFNAPNAGLGKATGPISSLTVAGHSLGGHLATAFQRLFSNSIPVEAVTVNGMGTGQGTTVDAFFDALAQRPGTSFDSTRITNLYGSAGPNLATGELLYKQYGDRPQLYTEGAGGTTTFGHGVEQMSDSAAVYDLLFRADSDAANGSPLAVAGNFLDVFKAASATSSFTLESVVNAFGKLFVSDYVPIGISGTDNRESLYEKIVSIRSRIPQGGLTVKSLVGMNSYELVTSAGTTAGLGYRFALNSLNPFAVLGPSSLYDGSSSLPAHNANGKLDLIESSSLESPGLSPTWIAARSDFLVAVMQHNESDGVRGAQGVRNYYSDQNLGISIGLNAVGRQRYIFAGDSNTQAVVGFDRADFLFGGAAGDQIVANEGNDYVEAGGGNDVVDGGKGVDEVYGGGGDDEILGREDGDRLFGGAGADRLEGGKGNDYLDGGSGFDTYVYGEGPSNETVSYFAPNGVEYTYSVVNPGDGVDTIHDPDGLGQIVYKGRALAGGTQTGRGTYEDEAGVRYLLSDDANGPRTLVVDGQIAVENFETGMLGISLIDADSPAHQNPQLSAQRVYTQDPRNDPLPYPSDRGAYGLDLDSYLRRWFVNAYGSDANDSFNLPAQGPLNFFPGFHGRGGDDYLKIAVTAAFGGNSDQIGEMGRGNDFIDASQSSFGGTDVNQFALTLAGGSGDDYILGGSGRDSIYGDNYSASNQAGIFYFDNFQFNVAASFSRTLNEEEANASQREILSRSGFMSIRNGPFYEAHSFGAMNHLLSYDGIDAAIRYLQLENWIFSNGIQSVMEYLVGVDATFDDFIDGGGGNDVIVGGNGSDTIYGGDGNDNLNGDGTNFVAVLGPLASMLGTPGDDFIDGGNGNDTIVDTGDSSIVGGAGDDSITWSAGAVGNGTGYLDGGDGNDTITSSGNALIDGGAGNDRIVSGSSSARNSVVYGGDGDDNISGIGAYADGGAGNDTYSFVGEIHDLSGEDTIILQLESKQASVNAFLRGASATSSQDDLSFQNVCRVDDNLVHEFGTFGGGTNAVRIYDWFSGPVSPIEHIFTRNGVSLTQEDLRTWGSFQSGTNLSEEFVGGQYADRILAYKGDDAVASGEGDDLIAGGLGDDYLDGGSGNDSYFYFLGHGNDLISDAEGVDEIRFGQGIAADAVSVTIGSDEAILTIAGGTITLLGSGDSRMAIERLAFADGSTLALSTLLDTAVTAQGSAIGESLSGNSAANTLTGGLGEDFLQGGAGDDVYVFRVGDGVDHIVDTQAEGELNTVRFGPGITPAMLRLAAGSLTIEVGSNGDAIHLESVEPGDVYGDHDVEKFVFDDGTVLSYADLLARGLDLEGTALDDVIVGSNTVDRISGLKGDDVLAGGHGSDTYLYEAGDGSDLIVEALDPDATDILRLGSGINPETVRVVRAGDQLTIEMDSADDGVTLSSWFSSARRSIERVEFAGGAKWTAAELESRAVGAAPPASEPDVPLGSVNEPSAEVTSVEVPAVATNAGLADDSANDYRNPVNLRLARLEGLNGQAESDESSSRDFIAAWRDISATDSNSSLDIFGPANPLSANISNARNKPFLDSRSLQDAMDEFESDRTESESVPQPPEPPHTPEDSGNFPDARDSLGLTRWAIAYALHQFHMSRADEFGAGAEVAAWVGGDAGIRGISGSGSLQLGAVSTSNLEAHALPVFSGLQDGFAKLI